MEEIKKQRSALFANEQRNQEQIKALYYEIEMMKLQYMLLKRQQLKELKEGTSFQKVIESVEGTEKINEDCIRILRNNLLDNGYRDRLEALALLAED
ncbi:hypothetical protein [Paenibacillus sp. HB172176]|uniref:hypothetical protein n=1 Tax=Paenibacillus sp. HB172176 TaxID=2493690 RepID=UPI0014394CF2|nr:hypothetical protein [Paenibacillus sp. HB172176]